MNACYDIHGKLFFEGGENVQPNENENYPTIHDIKIMYGEDTAELYARALERELTEQDIAFAMASDAKNEPLKVLRGWQIDNGMEDSSSYFIRDLVIDYWEKTK